MNESTEQQRARWAAEDAAFERRDARLSRATVFIAGVVVGYLLGVLVAVAL